MKKRIKPVKAHLLRGAFWLLLLLAACAIPFVFGQRVIIERSTPELALAPSRPPEFPNGCVADWRIVPSLNSSANTNILFSIGGVPYGSYVWAVGVYYGDNFIAHTLAEAWDGSAWVVQSSANPGSTGNQLNAVAVGPGEIWAVGYFTDDNFTAHALVDRPTPSPRS